MVDWSALDPHADGVTRERFLHGRDAEADRLRAAWAREDAAKARRKAETLALARVEPVEPGPFVSPWTRYVEADRAATPARRKAAKAARDARRAGTRPRWDPAHGEYTGPDDDEHQDDDDGAGT
jgi:hypothetical protein